MTDSAQDPIDKEIFNLLLKTDIDVLKRLSPKILEKEQIKFFDSNFSFNPHITYPYLEGEGSTLLEKKDVFLSQVSSSILPSISNLKLGIYDKKELLFYYKALIKRRTLYYDLLIASKNNNFSEFGKISEMLYGTPSIEIFNTYIKNINEEIKKEKDNPKLTDTIKALEKVLPVSKGNAFENEEIDLEPFRKVLQPKMSPIIKLLSKYPEDTEFDASIIKQVFEKALEEQNNGEYKVLLSEIYINITVNSISKEIFIPSNRKVNKNKLLGLVAHEVYTHVARANRSESRFPYEILKKTGLNEYKEAEEAIATFSEASFNPDIELDLGGGDLHFATCLALGLDGNKRDFKDVFKIISLVKTFKDITSGKPPKDAFNEAKRETWRSTLKVFEGTPGNIPGLCFSGNIMYGEGRLKLFRYLEKNKGKNIEEFWEAKYSPWDQKHLDILEKYQ